MIHVDFFQFWVVSGFIFVILAFIYSNVLNNSNSIFIYHVCIITEINISFFNNWNKTHFTFTNYFIKKIFQYKNSWIIQEVKKARDENMPIKVSNLIKVSKITFKRNPKKLKNRWKILFDFFRRILLRNSNGRYLLSFRF